MFRVKVGEPDPKKNDTIRKRNFQQVVSLEDKLACVAWMSATSKSCGTERGIAGKAIKQYPHLFRSKSYNVNWQKANDWWKKQEKLLEKRQKSIVRYTEGTRKRKSFKTGSGRGRKVAAWTAWVYEQLLAEFTRVRKAGVPVSPALLKEMALSLIRNSANPEFNSQTLDVDGKTKIVDRITYAWIHTFREKKGIVLRRKTGRKLASPEKEDYLEQCVAQHMGKMKRGFDSGELKASEMCNMDETHLIFAVDNHQTLEFEGASEVKYVDVVSGTEGMTVCITICGGDENAYVSTPMVIFKNKDRNYPIQRVPDDIVNVTYRTQPNAFMDGVVMKAWLRSRGWGRPKYGQKRTLLLDNFSGHEYAGIEGDLAALQTTRIFFPPNVTDVIQPCDSFVIQKFKALWRNHWSQYLLQAVQAEDFMDASKASVDSQKKNFSGKLKNPGKHWYLRCVAKCVEELNQQKDADGKSWAFKAMLQTGHGVCADGKWQKSQLTAKIQNIIEKHPKIFDGSEEPELRGREILRKARRDNSESLTYLGGKFYQVSLRAYLESFVPSKEMKSVWEAAKKHKHAKNVPVTSNGVSSPDASETQSEKSAAESDAQKQDNISHEDLHCMLADLLPDPIPLGIIEPRVTREQNAAATISQVTDHGEIYDTQVAFLMKACREIIARSNDVKQVPYAILHPSSPHGTPAKSESIHCGRQNGVTCQGMYTTDHFELLVISTELLKAPREDNDLRAAVIHVDSLNGSLAPKIKPLRSIRSRMGREIAEGSGNAVCLVPGVQQPSGRMCGVVICLNHLIFAQLSLAEIWASGVDDMLKKYRLPEKDKWTGENLMRTCFVLVEEYVLGPNARPVNQVLESISAAILAESRNVPPYQLNAAQRAQKKRQKSRSKPSFGSKPVTKRVIQTRLSFKPVQVPGQGSQTQSE